MKRVFCVSIDLYQVSVIAGWLWLRMPFATKEFTQEAQNVIHDTPQKNSHIEPRQNYCTSEMLPVPGLVTLLLSAAGDAHCFQQRNPYSFRKSTLIDSPLCWKVNARRVQPFGQLGEVVYPSSVTRKPAKPSTVACQTAPQHAS